jgi:hypothetical protein
MSPNTGLRFRVYVSGELADEDWAATATESGALQLRHKTLTDAADRDGTPWLIEVYDPDMPEDEAYLRIGTDRGRMTMPLPVSGYWLDEEPPR